MRQLPPAGKAVIVLRGLVLVALLLSACGSGPVANVGEVVPEAAGQSAGVERLGLMRVEAADVASHADWEAWFAEPWQVREGVPAVFYPIRFDCTQGDCTVSERLEVSSCALLFEADAKGLDVEGMDEPQASYLQRRLICYAGRSLAATRDADTSYVADYVLDASTLRELPGELGYPVAPAQFAEARRIDAEGDGLGAFLDQLPGAGGNGPAQATEDGLRIDDGDGWTREWLLMGRGDLDGDGVEDLLIGVNLYITDEALRFGSTLFAVTRSEPGEPMRVVYEIPVLGSIDACSDNTRCANFLLPEKR